MSENIWMGGIFLKEEGGYDIVIKALNHYKKRIRTIDNTPGLKDAGGMFASILQQEAMKTHPKVQQAIDKINEFLKNQNTLRDIQGEVPLIEKALRCYQSDIQKATDIGDSYYLSLFENLEKIKNDMGMVKDALERINKYG